jgi:hypothetical protein
VGVGIPMAGNRPVPDLYKQPMKRISFPVSEEFDRTVTFLAGAWSERDGKEWHRYDVYCWLLANAMKLQAQHGPEWAVYETAEEAWGDDFFGDWTRASWDLCEVGEARRLPHNLSRLPR